MRQHGVQQRLLLVWEESVRRIGGKLEFPVESLHFAAKLMRSFVEDYHQHVEEEYLFPKFRKANRLVHTVDTLKAQHDAGRKATDVVLELTSVDELKGSENSGKLVAAMRQSIRMYGPHTAREDTTLFPAFRDVINQDVTTTRLERRSTRKKKSTWAKGATSKSSIKWPRSKRNSESLIWRYSPQNPEPG